jgi:protein TonB
MFDDALLDSAPARAPLLRGSHYALASAVGALGFLLAHAGLRLFFVPAPTRMVAVAGAAIGAVTLGTALMLCYVYVDADHLGLNVAWWLGITLVLNVAGFVGYLIYAAARTGHWKRAAIPIAYLLQVILLGVLVLIPLVHVEALPKTWLLGPLVSAPAPPAAPPAQGPRRAPRRLNSDAILREPASIPHNIPVFHDEPMPAEGVAEITPGVPGGVPGGSPNGVPFGIPGTVPWGPSPPPPPTAKVEKPRMLRLGGQVTAAKLVYQPRPEYPSLAKMARIQGTVILEAIIAKDGTVRELRALSGHPLLVKAALEAVQRWRYLPTLLNGEPVEVLTEIDVSFSLAD